MAIQRFPTCLPFLFALAFAGSGRAQAQRSTPACALERSAVRDLVLADGRDALMFPEVLSFRHDSLLMLGGGVLTGPSGIARARQPADSLIAGLLLTGPQHTPRSVIPVPPGLRTARSFRVHPRSDGWDVVFFVPDPRPDSSWTSMESGALWYGQLVNSRWAGLERVGHVTNAMVMRPNTSELLLRDGRLHFALTFGNDIYREGGLIVWHRSTEGHWTADTLATPFAPLSATTAAGPDGSDGGFYVSLISEVEGLFAADLRWVSAVNPAVSRLVRRSVTGSMNAPVVHPSGDSLYVSWWQGGVNSPRTVWYQPLTVRHENASERSSLVTNDVWQFSFLAVQEENRTRLVWVYGVPGSTDSAEVAVVANGEPTVIGRVAFPFGFLTNGVASGDRSFIFATSPHSTPGAEPSASRILELRVSCREGT